MDNNINEKIEKLRGEISEETEKFSTKRIDMSFGELINLYKDGELIIRPQYQRYFRWKDKQKTALIESILLSIPIPPIFVAEIENGKWELIDGLQRMSTIITFFGALKPDNNVIPQNTVTSTFHEIDTIDTDENDRTTNQNNWKLSAGELVSSLEGLSFTELPVKFQINLKRAGCRVEILQEKNSQEMKYELFKRLNSGGSKLTAQEIRNAVYRGKNDANINKLLEGLSKYDAFKKLVTSILSDKQKIELYDQELVLRFLAFFIDDDYIGTTEKCLDEFMKKIVNNDDFDIPKYKKVFTAIFDILDKLNTVNIFKGKNSVFSPTVFDGITVGLAKCLEKGRTPTNELLLSIINAFKEDSEFNAHRNSSSSYQYRIKNRIERAIQIFEEYTNN